MKHPVPSDRPTPLIQNPPMVLVLGCSAEFIDRCRHIEKLANVMFLECDIVSLATTAAQWRPFAVIVPSDVLGFDGAGFRSLANAVGAALLEIPNERVPLRLLEERLSKELLVAEKKGRTFTRGRAVR